MLADKRLIAKVVGFGFLVWLIPFVAGFFLVDQNGNFTVDPFIAKSVFLVIGSLVGAICLYRVYGSINQDHLRWGVVIGIVWMVISWVLDVVILLPLSGDSIGQWFGAIGVRYVSMLFVAVLVGAVAQRMANR